MATDVDSNTPVLHVLVIGFHHKKGNQVEYAYPPIQAGQSVDSHEVPDIWKNLASLALPDGAHNYKKDTVYFHLPSKDEGPPRTVYGVSCYRQMDATELKSRGSEVTRNSVQKSVCVLSRLPLYGLIEAKLELITYAYFKERDFSQVSLLEDTFKNLNSSLSGALVTGSQVFLGLSCRELVQIFRNKILVLFKLILLERRVLFFSSPVKPLVSVMLTVLSLFPGMIERGLEQSASYSPLRQVSSTMKVTKAHASDDPTEEYLEVHYTTSDNPRISATAEIIHNTKSSADPPGRNNPGPGGRHNPKIGDIDILTLDDSDLAVRADSKTVKNEVVRKQPQSEGLLDVENITHVEVVQSMDLDEGVDILSSSPSKSLGLSHPLAQVEGITHLEKVQLRSVSDSENQEIERGFPDEGTVAKNEEMIEAEDSCFSWEEDTLLLEIDAELETDEKNVDLNEKVFAKSVEEKLPGQHMENTDTSAQAKVKLEKSESMISQDSNHSGQSSSGVGSKIKDKLSNMWYGSAENGVELEEMRSASPTTLTVDNCGFPLSIFTKGVLCHPYLSLQYYDLLSDVNVRGCVLGATNVLFKQKKNILDAIVEVIDVEDVLDGKIEIQDPELRKQLNLTTADLRFADAIAKAVIGDTDETEWEGGDEWIRGQFRAYLSSLLVTVQNSDEASVQDFNTNFVAAWKTTHNYKVWKSGCHSGLDDVKPGHICHGQMGVGDVKLKFAHTMQSTEHGKKINAALGTTGRAVVQTGKAVGGAFNIAKKSVSSWFTSIKDWNHPSDQVDVKETKDKHNTAE